MLGLDTARPITGSQFVCPITGSQFVYELFAEKHLLPETASTKAGIIRFSAASYVRIVQELKALWPFVRPE
jgi:hypothetical protein